jgi:hypothetical protein
VLEEGPKVRQSVFNPPNPNATMNDFTAGIKLKGSLDKREVSSDSDGIEMEERNPSKMRGKAKSPPRTLVVSGSVEKFDKELTNKMSS